MWLKSARRRRRQADQAVERRSTFDVPRHVQHGAAGPEAACQAANRSDIGVARPRHRCGRSTSACVARPVRQVAEDDALGGQSGGIDAAGDAVPVDVRHRTGEHRAVGHQRGSVARSMPIGCSANLSGRNAQMSTRLNSSSGSERRLQTTRDRRSNACWRRRQPPRLVADGEKLGKCFGRPTAGRGGGGGHGSRSLESRGGSSRERR